MKLKKALEQVTALKRLKKTGKIFLNRSLYFDNNIIDQFIWKGELESMAKEKKAKNKGTNQSTNVKNSSSENRASNSSSSSSESSSSSSEMCE